MRIKNLSPHLVGTFVTSVRPPLPAMAVVVRATFEVSKDGALRAVDRAGEDVSPETDGVPLALRAPPRPLSAAEHREDDDDFSGGALAPSDFADFKPHAEVLFRGSCHVPRGALPECPVKIDVGDWSKTLRVTGRRIWGGTPAPFTTMPLDWTNAYGGPGYEKNPAGRGHEADEMPNVFHATDVPSRSATLEPAGFGPINRRWPQRTNKLGKQYGDDYRRTRAPFYATDLDPTFFQEASPDQWLSPLRGDESVSFHNLHPDASVVHAKLPGIRVRVFYRDVAGAFREIPMVLDTVFADLDVRRLELTWRGRAEVTDDDLEDVATLLVAEERLSESSAFAHYEALAAAFEADPLGLAGQLPPLGAGPPEATRGLASMLDAGLGDAQPAEVKDAAPFLDAVIANASQNADVAPAIADKRARALEADVAGPPRTIKPGAYPYLGLRRHVREVIARSVEAREKALRGGVQPEALEKLESLEAVADDPRWPELDPSYSKPLPLSTDAPGPGANLVDRDFTDADLTGVDLTGANLEGAIFTRARLERAVLRGARVYGTTFYKALLTEAKFVEADLTRANFTAASAAGAVFDGANLEQCCFEDALLEDASFLRAVGEYAVFTRARLARSVFREASLRFLEMDEADLSLASFLRADLHKGRFKGSLCAGTRFDGADLARASFAEAELAEARFVEAKADDSIWTSARATRAIFAFSRMRGAHLDRLSGQGADFHGADLKNARFYRANLEGALLTSSNLFGAELSKAKLEGARLGKANLYEARFGQTNLKDCDLTGANLKRSTLEQT